MNKATEQADVEITEGFPEGWGVQDRPQENTAILFTPDWLSGKAAICLRPRATPTKAWLPIARQIAAALASAKPAQAGEYEGHTAGPWEAKPDYRRTFPWRVEGPNAHVAEVCRCRVGDGKDLEAEANARLMAAAPDLLARAEAAEARVLSLETRLAAMGEALKPFAEAAEINDGDTLSRMRPDNFVVWIATGSWTARAPITLGDLRRSRAILSTEASHHG